MDVLVLIELSIFLMDSTQKFFSISLSTRLETFMEISILIAFIASVFCLLICVIKF